MTVFLPAPPRTPALSPQEAADALLTREVIAHLDIQIEAAQRLLAVVLDQGKAIRARNVHEVVRYAGILQVEMQRRQAIEGERAALLGRAAVRLGTLAAGVTLELLTSVMDPAAAAAARERSAQLRGLLTEIQREHMINRALMTQEMAFLDHLLRLVDQDSPLAYGATGDRRFTEPAQPLRRRRILDMQA